MKMIKWRCRICNNEFETLDENTAYEEFTMHMEEAHFEDYFEIVGDDE
jgi:hypothetical protein